MKCLNCGQDTKNPKFCSSSCAAKLNNRLYVKKEKTQHTATCLGCGVKIHYSRKYCSGRCQADKRYADYIEEWKAGKISGLNTIGVVTPQIKKYLLEKYNNSCSLCGWSKVNPHTGKIPLVADHIDGNHENNSESNLRLICWNCDSLSPTFAGGNRGNGRKTRKNLSWK